MLHPLGQKLLTAVRCESCAKPRGASKWKKKLTNSAQPVLQRAGGEWRILLLISMSAEAFSAGAWLQQVSVQRVEAQQTSQEEHRVWHIQADFELGLARDVKDYQKGFYKCINIMGNTGPQLNGSRELVTYDVARQRYSMPFLPKSLQGKLSFRNPRHLRPEERSGARKTYPSEGDSLGSTRTKWMYITAGTWQAALMTRELANIARTFLIIFEQSWQLGEISEDWKRENTTPIFKKPRITI